VAGPAPIRPLPALTAPAAPPRHLPDFPPDGVLNEERSKTVALCRIYVDEVGNHDLTHTDDPNQRFLSLTGVILESSYTLRVLQPEMDQIKRELFQDDPDEPVIFHRKEMVNKRPPFHLLRDVDLEHRFNSALLDALARWDYRVITKVKPKSTNIVGLQLADLVAHPSRREILMEHQLLVDDRDVFGDRICAILRQSKYHRSWRTGQIEEYGKKLLP
jgi:hypothetical protein